MAVVSLPRLKNAENKDEDETELEDKDAQVFLP
jgi:hypothetical protein